MGLPSLTTLARIAAVGGIITVGANFYFKGHIESKFRSSEYYKKSFEILKSNPGVVHYLGKPILEGSLNLGDPKNNYCTGTEAKFEDDHTTGNMAVTLSHIEFKEAAWNIISKMMKIDSVLDDLHPQITREEIKALVQLEQGQAISVYIEKDHGPPWKLVVPREATLQQLKAALKTKVKLKLDRNHIPKNISWKYVWRTYWLVFQGTKLEHDNKKLTDYGVSNKSRLNFVKKINFKKSENAEITSSVQI